MYDITSLSDTQALVDIHPKTKKPIPWDRKKKETNKLAESHQRISEQNCLFKDQSKRLMECGRFLEFRNYYNAGQKQLQRANFCKYRLCPMCSWRRSLKIFGQASQVMDEAKKQGYVFIFVTLTVRNCTGAHLQKTIDELYQATTRLRRQGWFKKAIQGWMQVFEVTHNVDPDSDYFDTYHSHLHAIWAVKPSYFKKDYISQAKLTEYWQKSLKVDYKPIVHIQRAEIATKGHIREVAKYSVKPGDIIVDDDKLTDSAVTTLDYALYNRRLISWGGILKKIRADFNFDDPETGDLVHVDGQEINEELQYMIERYYWHAGVQQYRKSNK